MQDNIPLFPEFDKLIQKTQKDPNILAVILFGSFNRGEYYRDIDICLVVYPFASKSEILIEYLSEFHKRMDLSIFQQLPLYIRQRVQKEGKILFNKDYYLLFDIYIENIKKYNLFKPHFDTFLEVVKNG